MLDILVKEIRRDIKLHNQLRDLVVEEKNLFDTNRLDNLAEGVVVNRIAVAADVAERARLALRRMIEIKAVETARPGR